MSYIYPAPPLKVIVFGYHNYMIENSSFSSLTQLFSPFLQLKQNGWIGNFALGASYISLPWYDSLPLMIIPCLQLLFKFSKTLGLSTCISD